jgi:hypothetical protein
VSAGGLAHYHAVVKFPTSRPWRDERPDTSSLVTRCERVEQALRLATSSTPEPFLRKDAYQPRAADIDVRPYDADRNHARYLPKGMRHVSDDDRTFTSDDLLRDSGLIVLPHLPGKKLHTPATNTKSQTSNEQSKPGRHALRYRFVSSYR